MNNKVKIFTENDYNSPDGMMTSIWGPPLWHFLHTISFNYPCKPTVKDKEHYYNFVLSLKNILPCKYCRDNLPNNLKKTKFSKKMLKNRHIFSKWMYTLHEEINKMLGKKSGLSYTQVKDTYEQFRSRCIDKPTKNCKIPTLEKGCTTPFYGVKSKCVLEVVPKKSKKKSFKISPSCIIQRKK
jgi:hypothetical protein|tara:strand:+ start:536 stop:1084 length:549 start_codon:yes stop_codon:yes gene_type:complete